MDAQQKLEEIFRHFPGIGPRQAKRFVYYLLTKSDRDLGEFSKLLTDLKQSISLCGSCRRFFPNGSRMASDTCSICADPNREHDVLMIVSRDIDLQAVERSRAYAGLYFVLGGSVPILEEKPDEHIRQADLLKRIEDMALSGLREVILATSVNPEGEHTAHYLTALLQPLMGLYGFRISTLGRGLSTGTELEYSDSETLKSALENRR